MIKTILILAANPQDTSRLRIDQEVREIDNGLQRSRKRDDFILKQIWAVRRTDFRRAMLDFKPDIVHFCGHGSGEDGIAFEDENGQATLISTDALSGFFELFADKVECVILNACYSEVQAAAIAEHIPYVIGMKKAIGDTAAIEFAVAFYDALGAGESVEYAHRLACNAIQLAGSTEYLIPILKKHSKIHRTHTMSEVKLDQKIDNIQLQTDKILERLDLFLGEKKGSAMQVAHRASKTEDDFGTPTTLEGYFNRGVYYYGIGKYNEAIVNLSKAIQLKPNNADAYYVRGNAYYQLNSYEQAVADYTQVIQLRPDNPFPYYLRGDIYCSWLDKIDLGIADLNEAIHIKGDFAQAYALRGATSRRNRDYDQAIKDLEQAIHFEPQNKNAWYWLGLSYAELRKHDKAIESFSEAIRLEPGYINAYFYRGIELYEIDDFDKSLIDLTKIIEIYPYYDHRRFQQAYVYRGLIYMRKDDNSKAITDFSEAIRLKPDDATCYYYRGQIYSRLEKRANAIADYERAIESSSSTSFRQQVTDRLLKEQKPTTDLGHS